MLKNGQIGRALAVYVNNGTLLGETVGNLSHVAEQHGRRSHDFDGDGTKLRHCVGTGIELHHIISAADTSVAGGENDIRALKRRHSISRGQPLSGERLRVKVDDDLPLLAAKRSRR